MKKLSEDELNRKINTFLSKKIPDYHPTYVQSQRSDKDRPAQRFTSPSVELLNRLFVGKPTTHLT